MNNDCKHPVYNIITGLCSLCGIAVETKRSYPDVPRRRIPDSVYQNALDDIELPRHYREITISEWQAETDAAFRKTSNGKTIKSIIDSIVDECGSWDIIRRGAHAYLVCLDDNNQHEYHLHPDYLPYALVAVRHEIKDTTP